MNIVNDILVNTLFPDTDFVQTLDMDSVVPKYVENQEKGNPSVCKNCAEAPFRDLHIYGRSEQVTTTGAQLLDLSDLIGKTETKNGATYKINEDQSISVSGTPTEYTSFYLKRMQLKAGSYYFKSNQKNSNVFIQMLGTQVDMNNGFTLDEDADAIGVYVVFNVLPNNKQEFNLTFASMLNAGETPLPWEPYTGGKPSPSPDYPQEIVSAGGDGSLNVMVRGKNLLGGRFYYANYANDVLKIDGNMKENEVKLPFAPTYETFGVCKAIKCRKGKTYIISVTNPNKNAVVGMAEYETIEKAIDTNNALGFVGMSHNALKKSYIAKSDGILVCGIAGKWTNGSTTTHECTESELLQVEEASEATSYEPYHEPRSMSVTTPNGLPGIPVTSSGNYTDENGQQWICDEVDLGRGVYVQRVAEAKIKPETVHIPADPKWYDSEKSHSYETDYAEPTVANADNGKGFCSHLSSYTFAEFYNKGIETGWLGVFGYGVFNFSKSLGICKTIDEFLTWIQDVKIYKMLATPIETPLTASEIAAYKSLRTYRGTTIVEAEDKAGISVKYNMPMPKLSKNGALRRWFKRHPII